MCTRLGLTGLSLSATSFAKRMRPLFRESPEFDILFTSDEHGNFAEDCGQSCCRSSVECRSQSRKVRADSPLYGWKCWTFAPCYLHASWRANRDTSKAKQNVNECTNCFFTLLNNTSAAEMSASETCGLLVVYFRGRRQALVAEFLNCDFMWLIFAVAIPFSRPQLQAE